MPPDCCSGRKVLLQKRPPLFHKVGHTYLPVPPLAVCVVHLPKVPKCRRPAPSQFQFEVCTCMGVAVPSSDHKLFRHLGHPSCCASFNKGLDHHTASPSFGLFICSEASALIRSLSVFFSQISSWKPGRDEALLRPLAACSNISCGDVLDGKHCPPRNGYVQP